MAQQRTLHTFTVHVEKLGGMIRYDLIIPAKTLLEITIAENGIKTCTVLEVPLFITHQGEKLAKVGDKFIINE